MTGTYNVWTWPADGSVEERCASDVIRAAMGDLARLGFCVFRDYWPADVCARLVGRIDELIESRPECVRRGSDMRLIAIEAEDDQFETFKKDALIEAFGNGLIGEAQKALFVMANRLAPIDGKPRRSGGEWHRDRVRPQYKALLYLSDVGPENGPFSILEGSDDPATYSEAAAASGFDFLGRRWRDEAMDPFLSEARARFHVLTGSAGTLVLFNSSLIHSGQPIRSGVRYALTSYYYAHADIDIRKMRKKFTPSLTPLRMPEFGMVEP